MAKRPTLTTISSGYYSTGQLNNNFSAINAAFDNTLSRDGSTPNTMSADIDLNNNDIINVKTIEANRIVVSGSEVTSTSPTLVWKGNWVTATDYTVNAIVHNGGSTYICVEAHTSGTFSTDLSASKWEAFVSSSTFLDEDDFASNSDTEGATQQSIKAYVNAQDVATLASAGTAAETYADSLEANTTQARNGTAGVFLSPSIVESASEEVAFSISTGAVAVDWSTFINAYVTLNENVTLNAPTNAEPGTWRCIRIIQDATGSRTLTLNSAYKTPGAEGVTLTTTANAEDMLFIYCVTTSKFYVFAQLDMS